MSATGKPARLWRSLEELADKPEFRRFVEAEFPSLAELAGTVKEFRFDRRRLLKLIGASLAFGGLAACSEAERIVPYVRQPEETIPGRPRYFATTLSSEGHGIGAIVESHEGRPTKVEGNPDHPASLGATDAIMQASVLALFDPDRSRTPLKDDAPASYDSFLEAIGKLRSDFTANGGSGFALLSDASNSPTLQRQMARMRGVFPNMRFYRHDALAAEATAIAAKAMFKRPLRPICNLDRAEAIVSLDADFLGEGPGRLAYARGFSDRRRMPKPSTAMNRLYAVQSTPTITGAVADHRLAAKPSAIDGIAAALLAEVKAPGNSTSDWIRKAAMDLKAAGRSGLVIAGEQGTPFSAAAALAINASLGAFGNTVDLVEPTEGIIDGGFADLAERMLEGEIDTLLVLGGNPVHTAPADIPIVTAMKKVAHIIHLGLYRDETAALAHWHIPAAHELESWSDLRAFDGTASIVQPLIEPLFGGRTAHEIVAAFLGENNRSPLDIVRAEWRDRGLDDDQWRHALRSGVISSTAFPTAGAVPSSDLGGLAPQAQPISGMEIRFVADPWLRDGRFANNAWLQELPRPLTKLVWSNAALFSPATAHRLGLENGHRAAIASGGTELEASACIVPGHPDDTVTLSFGFGRKDAGPVAAVAQGYDAFRLRRSASPWMAADVEIKRLDGDAQLITTQNHQSMEGRAIVRHATLAEFRQNPDFVNDGVPPVPTESLYPNWQYDDEAWGMLIDLNACIGCMACVAACQAENNIATVGPDECARGHEMHWLRIDRYYEGSPEDPDIFFQPVPCMHCEKAPCEIVCPVNATVHTHDGLNAQVYNRCIGTRYCSQNCPYKVRRFNFFEYQEFDKGEAGSLVAVRNPDVSVRSRGVMEKCTYCIQRISAARIAAQIDNRPIADGEVVTACQQACPTVAIHFGNLNDQSAKVAAAKQSPLNYALLAELNTRPRTTYLGKVANPNPKLKAGDGDDHAG